MNKANEKILKYKPDAERAFERWETYWNGGVTDRPILVYSNAKKDFVFRGGSGYKERCFGDADTILDDHLYNLSGTNFYGEALPAFWISLGTHEFASYMGAETVWAEGGGDTVWSKKDGKTLKDVLPLSLDKNNYYYKRIMSLYEKAAQKFDGASLIFTLDYHTNMDLLLSLIGDEQLCYETADNPELIDEAMPQARKIFKEMFELTAEAGKFDKYGYYYDAYSEKPYTTIACDFSALVGPETFRRWIMPTMEYEASLLDRVRLHWDGPQALRHFEDIMSIKKIHTVSFVPNPFESHTKYLDMFVEIQRRGKCVEFCGDAEEIKAAAKVLRPEKTVYRLCGNYSEKEFYELENHLKLR